MGVYIKNMEMPKNCHECRLYEGDIYYCSAADKMIDISDSSAEKCQFCPLVPVPPHGKLIDADELKASLVFAKETAEWAVPTLRAVLMVIDEMPTIFRAEGGET